MNFDYILKTAESVYTYSEFKDLVTDLAEKGRCTGDEVTDEKIDSTQFNLHRMDRIDRKTKLDPDLQALINVIECKFIWVVIVESWCGDAAQNLPLINKLASESPEIDLKIILRDANPEIMDSYLSNGARAIPKLICLDGTIGEEIDTWGPRPAEIQQRMLNFKKENPDADKEEVHRNLHLWYARDRGKALQKEFSKLIYDWVGVCNRCNNNHSNLV